MSQAVGNQNATLYIQKGYTGFRECGLYKVTLEYTNFKQEIVGKTKEKSY